MILDYLRVGCKIKSLRRKKGLTQAELAELVEVSIPYISNIELGKKSISVETLIRIANVLGSTIDFFLAETLEYYKPVSNKELAGLLDDCTFYESRVILATITSLKKALRDNSYLIKKKG